jgi:hypothetical protein
MTVACVITMLAAMASNYLEVGDHVLRGPCCLVCRAAALVLYCNALAETCLMKGLPAGRAPKPQHGLLALSDSWCLLYLTLALSWASSSSLFAGVYGGFMMECSLSWCSLSSYCSTASLAHLLLLRVHAVITVMTAVADHEQSRSTWRCLMPSMCKKNVVIEV